MKNSHIIDLDDTHENIAASTAKAARMNNDDELARLADDLLSAVNDERESTGIVEQIKKHIESN